MGEASTKAKNKYNKKAYRQVNLQIKPDLMKKLNYHCNKFSYSRNGFIVQAIEEKIEKDTGEPMGEFLKEKESQD